MNCIELYCSAESESNCVPLWLNQIWICEVRNWGKKKASPGRRGYEERSSKMIGEKRSSPYRLGLHAAYWAQRHGGRSLIEEFKRGEKGS